MKSRFFEKRWWIACSLAYGPSLAMAPALAETMFAFGFGEYDLPALNLYWILSFLLPAFANWRTLKWEAFGRGTVLAVVLLNGLVHGAFSYLLVGLRGALADGWID